MRLIILLTILSISAAFLNACASGPSNATCTSWNQREQYSCHCSRYDNVETSPGSGVYNSFCVEESCGNSMVNVCMAYECNAGYKWSEQQRDCLSLSDFAEEQQQLQAKKAAEFKSRKHSCAELQPKLRDLDKQKSFVLGKSINGFTTDHRRLNDFIARFGKPEEDNVHDLGISGPNSKYRYVRFSVGIGVLALDYKSNNPRIDEVQLLTYKGHSPVHLQLGMPIHEAVFIASCITTKKPKLIPIASKEGLWKFPINRFADGLALMPEYQTSELGFISWKTRH